MAIVKDLGSNLEFLMEGKPSFTISSANSNHSMELTITSSDYTCESQKPYQLMKMDIVQVLERYEFQMTSICYVPSSQTEKIIMMKPAWQSPQLR